MYYLSETITDDWFQHQYLNNITSILNISDLIHFLHDCHKSHNIAHPVDGEKYNGKEGNKS